MKKVIKLIILNIIFLSLLDFFLGQKVLNFFYSKNIIISPESKRLDAIRLQNNEKFYRIEHEYFHHTLKANVNVDSRWGNIIYKTCTDEYGFRNSCTKNVKNNKKNIAIIGDSNIEGLGLNYDNTLVGMLNNYSQENVINMGVTSYSPIVYSRKIQHYIENGLNIDEVIVFIDISDIDDSVRYFKCNNKDNVCLKDKQTISDINKLTIEEKFYFPLFHEIKTKIKEIKNIYRPNIYIYRKDYHRSLWTYSKETPKIKKGIENALIYMNELHNYLSNRNIPLSIAVYPIPGQILHDVENSKQVKIWREFCDDKCKKFINLFPIFFTEKSDLSNMDIIEKYYIKHDVHFNKEGNEKIFKELLSLKVF